MTVELQGFGEQELLAQFCRLATVEIVQQNFDEGIGQLLPILLR